MSEHWVEDFDTENTEVAQGYLQRKEEIWKKWLVEEDQRWKEKEEVEQREKEQQREREVVVVVLGLVPLR